MTVKTFIWNHFLTLLIGSSVFPTGVLLYQLLINGENRFDGFFWILGLFLLAATVVSIPYLIVMLLISAFEKKEIKWRKQKIAQIILSIASIIITIILSYEETIQVRLSTIGLVSFYSLVGTTLIYFPRKSWRLSRMEVK